MPETRPPKKLCMLAPVRCDEHYHGMVRRAAKKEGRSPADFQRRAITFYVLQVHPEMVDVAEDEVTDFGALQSDAAMPKQGDGGS